MHKGICFYVYVVFMLMNIDNYCRRQDTADNNQYKVEVSTIPLRTKTICGKAALTY